MVSGSGNLVVYLYVTRKTNNMKELNTFREFLNENEEEQTNENMGFSKAEILKMKEDLSNFLGKYDYIMAPVDISKVSDAVSILGRLTQHSKVK